MNDKRMCHRRASLTFGSMNFASQASVNTPDATCSLTDRIYGAGAVPELEVFEPGFIEYAKLLLRKGTLRPPLYFNFIFGPPAGRRRSTCRVSGTWRVFSRRV
jgi:3-keto-5-aminohexanoate cleavage enzyme